MNVCVNKEGDKIANKCDNNKLPRNIHFIDHRSLARFLSLEFSNSFSPFNTSYNTRSPLM